MGFPGGSEVKVSACNAGDPGLIPGSERSPGKGNGTPLQYSCLENPMDGGAWSAAVHGIARSRTRLRDFTLTFHFHALEKEMATYSSVVTTHGCKFSCCILISNQLNQIFVDITFKKLHKIYLLER